MSNKEIKIFKFLSNKWLALKMYELFVLTCYNYQFFVWAEVSTEKPGGVGDDEHKGEETSNLRINFINFVLFWKHAL